MIEIKIADATKLTPDQLLATAEYLMRLGGHELIQAPNVAAGVSMPSLVPPPPPPPARIEAAEGVSELSSNRHLLQNVEGVGRGVSADNYYFADDTPDITSDQDYAQAEALATEKPEDVIDPNFDRGYSTFVGGFEKKEPELKIGDNVLVKSNCVLDSEGFPWDARIHSAGQTKYKATGAWKLKREIEPGYVKEVQKELSEKVSGFMYAVTGIHPADEPKPSDPVKWDEPTPAVPAPPAPPRKPPVSQNSAPPAVTFANLMKRITEAGAAGKIEMPRVIELIQEHGVANLPLLAVRPDLIPAIYADLEKLIGD